MSDSQVFNKKTRTVRYNEPLGLRVEHRQVSGNLSELQVDYCVKNGQVRGVEGMVVTHIDGVKQWGETGSVTMAEFENKLKALKRKKEDFKVTFHSTGFLKAELQKEKNKAAKKKKNEAEAKGKEKARKKKEKEAAQKKKAKTEKSKKTQSASKSNGRVAYKAPAKSRPAPARAKVPSKTVIINPAKEVGLQIELNANNHVQILKCHKGSQAAGTKGFIMFKIESFHVYQSLNSVQNLLKKLTSATKTFKITFVKPEHMDSYIEWEKTQEPGSSSSSTSNGKRKAGAAFVGETKTERDFKKLKSENQKLKNQIKTLRAANKTLQKQVDAIDNGMAV